MFSYIIPFGFGLDLDLDLVLVLVLVLDPTEKIFGEFLYLSAFHGSHRPRGHRGTVFSLSRDPVLLRDDLVRPYGQANSCRQLQQLLPTLQQI